MDSDDEWKSLVETTDPESSPSDSILVLMQDKQFLNRLKSRLQSASVQVVDATLDGAARLRPVLRVISNLLTFGWLGYFKTCHCICYYLNLLTFGWLGYFKTCHCICYYLNLLAFGWLGYFKTCHCICYYLNYGLCYKAFIISTCVLLCLPNFNYVGETIYFVVSEVKFFNFKDNYAVLLFDLFIALLLCQCDIIKKFNYLIIC